MKDKDADIEQMLLNNKSLDDLIRQRIENEYISAIQKANEVKKKKRISDISQVPKDLIFTTKSIFRIFNRKSGTETKINGAQAEALLGLQNNIREKISNGQMNAFTTSDAYVKFDYADIYE